MDNIIGKNFSNIFFLTFRDKNTSHLYYKSKYSFIKFLILSFLSYSSIVVNMILLEILDDNDSKRKIKILEIVLLIIEGILIILFILWKLITKRITREKFFFSVYFIVSAMNLFNVNLQPLITIKAVEEKLDFFVVESIIPNIQYMIMIVFIFFIENNFIIYFIDLTVTLIVSAIVSIGMDWSEKYVYLFVIYAGGIFFILFVYFVNRRDKYNFILYRNAVTDLEKKKSFLDNLNSGLITINEKGCDYNLKVKEYLGLNCVRTPTPNTYPSNNNNNLNFQRTITKNNNLSTITGKDNNYELKNLMFNKFTELNTDMDKKIKEIFKRSEKYDAQEDTEVKQKNYDKMVDDLLDITRINEKYQNYFYVGNKVLNKPIHRSPSLDVNNTDNSNIQLKDTLINLRIYLRYNIITGSLEFFLYDITAILEVENLKASFKYKKLFLNKFSHEFKNPLLNIMQLVSNIKKRTKKDTENFPVNKKNNSYGNNYDNNAIHLKCLQPPTSSECLPTIHINNEESYKEIIHVKNLTMYLISLIADFDFISNTELKAISSSNKKHNRSRLKTGLSIKSKIGQSLVEMSNFKLSKIVKQCVKMIQSKIELSGKNITVSYLIDKNIPKEINSDFRRLKQVIFNLLTNSLKFTSNGVISIKVKKDFFQEGLINFEISDTGLGIKPEILEIIQEGNTVELFGNINNNSNVYGFGIGLDLVKKIISLLGENFNISSMSDVGTKISFSIHDHSHRQLIQDDKIKNNIHYNNSKVYIRGNNNSHRVNGNIIELDEEFPLKLFRKSERQRTVIAKNNIHKNLNLTPSKEIVNNNDPLNLKLTGKDVYHNNRENSYIDTNTINKVLFFNRDNNNLNKTTKKFSTFRKSSESAFYSDLVNEQMTSYVKNFESVECTLEIVNIDEYPSNKYNDSEDIPENNTIIYDRFIKINMEEKLDYDLEREYDFEHVHNNNSKLENKFKLQPILESSHSSSYEDEKYNSNKCIQEIPINNKLIQPCQNLDGKSKYDKTLRILLVDDERFIRNSETYHIKKFFKLKCNYDYEITECSDGVECLYKIFKGIQEGIKYDIIITDESMNFMRGTLMIKNLNTLMEENMMYKVKIYMVTSYEPWAIINSYGNICDGIITKPLSCENLSKIFEFLT